MPADMNNAFSGNLASVSGVLCTVEMVNVQAAATAGQVETASLPVVTPSVSLSCSGGSVMPTITGGPDITGYARFFTGKNTVAPSSA